MLEHIKKSGNEYLAEWWDDEHIEGYDRNFIQGMKDIREYENRYEQYNERKEGYLDAASCYFKKCKQSNPKDYMKAEYFYGMAIYSAYKYDFKNYHKFYQNFKKIEIKFLQYNSDCIEELNSKIDDVYFKIKEVDDICEKIKDFISLYQICVYQLTYDKLLIEDDEGIEDLYYCMMEEYSNDREEYIQAGLTHLNMLWYLRYDDFDEAGKYLEILNQISSDDDFVCEVQQKGNELLQ